MTLYMQTNHIESRISDRNKQTCSVLLKLLQFMQDYEEGRLENALTVRKFSSLLVYDTETRILTLSVCPIPS